MKRGYMKILRYEDIYDQYKPTDGDRPFDFIEGSLFHTIRRGIPGEDAYYDCVESPADVLRYHEAFQHLIIDSLNDLGITPRIRDPSCKERLPRLEMRETGGIVLQVELRTLREAKFRSFDEALVWMYRASRLADVVGASNDMRMYHASGVMGNLLKAIERNVFDVDLGSTRNVWMIVYNKLRAYFHTELETEVDRYGLAPGRVQEVFGEHCRTMRYVEAVMLTMRAYCKVVSMRREETALFESGVVDPQVIGESL